MTAFVRGVSAALTVSGVTQIRVRVDVAEHRGGAGRRDRLGRRVEGERRDDDLVARADAQRAQGDRDGLGAVGDPDRVPGAQIGGELLLEGVDLGAEDEPPAIEDVLDRRAASRRAAG